MLNGTLNQFARQMHEIAKSKGWWDEGQQRSISELLMLLASEPFEAFEEYRRGKEPNEIDVAWDSEAGALKPTGIPIEIADTIIRALDFCAYYGIDIEAALLAKVAYNNARPYRHGGKRL